MYREEIAAISNGAEAKVRLLKENPGGYIIMSLLGGIYIGFGVLISFTLGGQLQSQPYAKLVMAIFFSVALSLIIIAGAELFTGNNMVLAVGYMKHKVTIVDVIKIFVICWLGNVIGSALLAGLFNLTGLYIDGAQAAVVGAAAVKMNPSPIALLTRGVLCNFLVCLAVWCSFRCKTDAGKLIMVFWCIVAFFATGFEHSVANMTILALALINNGGNEAVTVGGYLYNLGLVSLGNMIGGVLFVAVPYIVAAKEKSK